MASLFEAKRLHASVDDVRACIEAGLNATSPGFIMEYRETLLATLSMPQLVAGTNEIGEAQCPVMAAGIGELIGELEQFAFAYDDEATRRFGSGFKVLTLRR